MGKQSFFISYCWKDGNTYLKNRKYSFSTSEVAYLIWQSQEIPLKEKFKAWDNDSQKRQAVSPEDEAKFLDFVKKDPHYNQYYDAFYILFKTGLRISEFCGLSVKDLDFKERLSM